MRPAGQNKISPRRPGCGDVRTDRVAGTGNSSARVPEEGSISGMPPVDEVGSFHLDRVSPTVAAEAAKYVNKGIMDSVPLLAVAKGGHLPDVAGAAPLAIAGVASSADLAGMKIPSVTGVVPPVDLAGMAFPVVLWKCPGPKLLEWRSRPLLGKCPQPKLLGW